MQPQATDLSGIHHEINQEDGSLECTILSDVFLKDRVRRAKEKASLVAEVFCITPRFAKWIFSNRRVANRSLKHSKIKEFSDCMSKSQWAVNGESIKIDSSGYLIDGQNRLRACQVSNAPFSTLVVFGVNRDHFATMDRNKPRGAEDFLHIEGCSNATQIAAGCRTLMILARSPDMNFKLKILPEEILNFYRFKTDHEALQHSAKMATDLWRVYRHPVSKTLALHYLFSQKSSVTADKFFSEWTNQTKKLEPLQRHLVKVTEQQYKGGQMPPEIRIGTIVNAWNLYPNGKRMNSANINFNAGDKLEKIGLM